MGDELQDALRAYKSYTASRAQFRRAASKTQTAEILKQVQDDG